MPRAAPLETDLSLSRINRLLRSLRSKCASLSAGTTALADAYTRSRITEYGRATGRGGGWAEEDAPPLAVFDDPKKLAGRALDRRSMMNMRSCKLVHDVVDAWRHILQASLPSPPIANIECRVQSLTSMCAAIVGRSMIGDVVEQRPDEEDSDSEEESDEEDAGMVLTQELYEAVPDRFRSWTLISHSLALILNSCPHNPTLLSCLLDLSLKYRLAQESRSILSAFLTLCVQPASASMAPPLAHPSHTEFLKELCARWTSTSSTTPPATPSNSFDNANPNFSKATFVFVFISALVDTQCHEAWTCKATARFARDLRQTDVCSYATLCAGLMTALVRIAPSPDDDRPERLALWLDSLPEQCYLAGDDTHTIITRILCTAQAAGLQNVNTARLGTESPMHMLQNTLLCSAVRCLSTPVIPSNDYMRGHLVALLRSTPSTATLDHVVGPCFDLTSSHTAESPSGSLALVEMLDMIMRRLEAFAAALREQSLARLEVSLWACALRHYQRMKLPEGSDSRASSAFRQTIVDARTAAGERRAAEDAGLERIRQQRRSPSASREVSPVPMQILDKPRRALGSVTTVSVHRPMRFQSASTTVSPVTTPKKPRAATRRSPAASPRRIKPQGFKPSDTNSLVLASLNTVSLKLQTHKPSDECDEVEESTINVTPRPRKPARRRVPQPSRESDSGSDWGREHGLRGTKRRRNVTTPRPRQCDTIGSSEEEDSPRPTRKRQRGVATPRATAPHTSIYAESSASQSEESGSDWAKEQAARSPKRRGAASARGGPKSPSEESESGSDWERDHRTRVRDTHGGGGSAPVQRTGRVRVALKGRATVGAPSSSIESDGSSSSTQSPMVFKSLLAEAARRRISLRDEPPKSPRVMRRRRRMVVDSEDESELEDPTRDSDIEIVVDVQAAAPDTAGDALDLFMYD